MSEIKVVVDGIQGTMSELSTLVQNLRNMADRINAVGSNLGIDGAARIHILANIRAIEMQVISESDTSDILRSKLESILRLYVDTEKRLANLVDGGDSLVDPGDDPGILDRIKSIIDELKSLIEKILGIIGILPGGSGNGTSEYAGEPVNMCIGSYVNDILELRLRGEVDLSFKRHYNSRYLQMGSMGLGWSHVFSGSLQIKDNHLVVVSGDGQQERYILNREGEYVSAFGGYDRILPLEDGYVLRKKNRAEVRYNSEGRIMSMTDKDGHTLSLSYHDNLLSKVEASQNRWLEFIYDSNLLTEVRDSFGRKVTYKYYNSMLTVAVAADGAEERYEYDQNGRLSAVINADGIRILENEYDDEGRVSQQNFPDGTHMGYAYTDDALVFTDRNGIQATYYHDQKLRHTSTSFETGTESYVYNDRNQRVAYTDLNGNTWKRELDDMGNVVSLTDPEGAVITYEYDDENHMIRTVNPLGAITTMCYDADGNMTEITDGIGATKMMRYEAGRLVETVDPDGRRAQYKYDEEGRLIEVKDGNDNSTHYAYDGAGRLVQVKDRMGHCTEFGYDEKDRRLFIRDALGQERRFTYTPTGRLESIQDFDGSLEKWTYDKMGMVSSYQDKAGRITSFERDCMSNVSRIIRPNGSEIKRSYDHVNRLCQERIDEMEAVEYDYDSNGKVCGMLRGEEKQAFAYDLVGRVVKKVDWKGREMTFQRDSAGHVIEKTIAGGERVRFYYDAAGRCIRQENSRDKCMAFEYSPAGKLVRRIDEYGRQADYEYNAIGKVSQVRYSNGNSISFSYDAEGHLTERKLSTGYTESYVYDALYRRIEVKDNEGRYKRLIYDASGRVTETINIRGDSVRYQYSPTGKLIKIVDELGQTTRYAYDDGDRLVGVLKGDYDDEKAKEILDNHDLFQTSDNASVHLTTWLRDFSGNIVQSKDALGAVENYVYDAYGRVARHQDRDENIREFSYLPGGLVESIKDADGTFATFSYDSLAHMTGMTDRLGTSDFGFDRRGQLTHSVDGLGNQINYDLNDFGALDVMNVGGRQIRYQYDELGRVKSMEDDGCSVKYYYDNDGRLFKREMPNQLTEIYRYTPAGQLAELMREDMSGIFYACSYKYDGFGNLSEICEKDHNGMDSVTAYEYDELNRLVSSARDGELQSAYSYDEFGNCIQSKEDGHVIDYRYNVLNQLIERIEDGETSTYYEYDARGNLVRETTNGQVKSYDYDSSNHLVKVTDTDGTEVSYLWDGLGHRLGKELQGQRTEYVTDFSKKYHNVMSEKSEDRSRDFLWDGGLVSEKSEGQRRWYFQDHLGSVAAVADDHGCMKESFKYNDFGKGQDRMVEDQIGFGYAGMQYDLESGSYFAQHRMYSPKLGRFLEKDNDRFIFTEVPESVNLYAYCRNNPLIYVDPNGTDCYIFYLPEWEDEALADQQDLADRYGYSIDQVHIIPVSTEDELTDAWNGMGTVNGETVDIDTVVINSHANPEVLGFGNSGHQFTADDIRNLDEKSPKELILYGCNSGHTDYVGTNPASEFAQRVNGAQVLASDGTVSMRQGNGEYESMNDREFRRWRLSNRDNNGWVVYQYDGTSVQTEIVNDKDMNVTAMTDELRIRRGTMC